MSKIKIRDPNGRYRSDAEVQEDFKREMESARADGYNSGYHQARDFAADNMKSARFWNLIVGFCLGLLSAAAGVALLTMIG